MQKLLSVFVERIFYSCEEIICKFDRLSCPWSTKIFDYGIILFPEMVVRVYNPLGLKRSQIAQPYCFLMFSGGRERVNCKGMGKGMTIACSFYQHTIWLLLDLRLYSTLRKKCSYLELFWPAFSRIWTEYGVSLRIQSKCMKMRGRITPNRDAFHAVQDLKVIGKIVRSNNQFTIIICT